MLDKTNKITITINQLIEVIAAALVLLLLAAALPLLLIGWAFWHVLGVLVYDDWRSWDARKDRK